MFDAAIRSGNIDLLNTLRFLNFRIRVRSAIEVAQRGDVRCLRWLFANDLVPRQRESYGGIRQMRLHGALVPHTRALSGPRAP